MKPARIHHKESKKIGWALERDEDQLLIAWQGSSETAWYGADLIADGWPNYDAALTLAS